MYHDSHTNVNFLDTGDRTDQALARSVDDRSPSLVQRMYLRLIDSATRLAYYLASGESFSTMIILVAWAIFISLFLHKCSSKSPSTSRKKSRIKCNKNVESNDRSSTRPNGHELKIIELKAETYNGMVRALKLGCRSIIVLVDQQTKESLLADFKTAVWPYRRNKPLQFGYLCLDKNLVWYKTLLERVLDCENLRVNKKNCIGTVLSLNGFNKYLRIYHAKHHETDKTDNGGAFLGFEDREGDLEHGAVHMVQSETKVHTVNLLEKLPDWLEKVFDNSTKRYYIDEWPEEIN